MPLDKFAQPLGKKSIICDDSCGIINRSTPSLLPSELSVATFKATAVFIRPYRCHKGLARFFLQFSLLLASLRS